MQSSSSCSDPRSFFLLIGKEKNEVGSSASVCGTVVKLYMQFLVLDLIRR